jgi:hypothetical protein
MLCMSTFRNDSGTADIHHYHTNDLYKLIFFFFAFLYTTNRGEDRIYVSVYANQQVAVRGDRTCLAPPVKSGIWR